MNTLNNYEDCLEMFLQQSQYIIKEMKGNRMICCTHILEDNKDEHVENYLVKQLLQLNIIRVIKKLGDMIVIYFYEEDKIIELTLLLSKNKCKYIFDKLENAFHEENGVNIGKIFYEDII